MTSEQTTLLRAAEAKRQQALAILDELGLMERWAGFGRPVLVGAVAHGLVHAPDIDMEIYCPKLEITHGFDVLTKSAAASPKVISAYFENHLHDDDKALYWQLKYRHDDGTAWKIDMWSAPDDYALPRGEHLVAPLRAALTPALRAAILDLKRRLADTPAVQCLSIDLYRAVVADGVVDFDSLRRWLENNPTGLLSDWRP